MLQPFSKAQEDNKERKVGDTIIEKMPGKHLVDRNSTSKKTFAPSVRSC